MVIKMKKIYIVLTHTGTMLSRIIKYYTKDEFSHVSIALDSELEEMYSFGRLNPYNPFWGGFVHERINGGTFKVYSLLVEDEQYNRMKKIIAYFEENKDKYKFNIIGLICVSIHKKIGRKNTFYCAEFVKHVLKSAGVLEVNKLPLIIKPENFKEIENLKLEYKGLLKKYKKKKDLKIKEILQNKKISYI